jgi:hypothetical protein
MAITLETGANWTTFAVRIATGNERLLRCTKRVAAGAYV